MQKSHRACIILAKYFAISFRGIRSSRQSPIIRASTAAWLVARGNKETFNAQIIVTAELSPEDNLYLRCLTNKLKDTRLANQLAEDYREHQDEDIYISYMQQITTANIRMKGGSTMICEGILNLCGTSSEEIIERTKKEEAAYYLPKINQLSSQNDQLSTQNNQLSWQNSQLSSQNSQLSSQNADLFSQIDYLKSLLTQNGIPFDL